MRVSLNLSIEFSIYPIYEWRTAVEEATHENKEIYSWVINDCFNWLQKGIEDTTCLVVLPKGLPDMLKLPMNLAEEVFPDFADTYGITG